MSDASPCSVSFALLDANAFFVGAEFALISARRDRSSRAPRAPRARDRARATRTSR